MPTPIPKGVVIAKSTDSVGLSQSNFHEWGAAGEEVSREDVREEESNSEAMDGSGGGMLLARGSEAIRIPRDRPSKSWWNIIAVTSDAENGTR
jgi:hypothetical protein